MYKRAKYLRRNLLGPEGQPTISEEMLESFVETGSLRVDNALPAYTLQALKVTVDGLFRRPLPFSRPVTHRGWVNTNRVTLCFERRDIREWMNPIQILSPELVVASTWAQNTVRQLGQGAIDLGTKRGRPSWVSGGQVLASHAVNRAVAHRMHGTPEDPALIPIHIDPGIETGAAVAVALDHGNNAVTGDPILPGNMTVFACKDTCEAMGIKREAHGMSATAQRDSLVFTHMDEGGVGHPLTLGEIKHLLV